MVGRLNIPFAGRIRTACTAFVLAALAAALIAPSPAAAATGGAGPKQTSCPVLPAAFTSTGGPAGFTMLIRINNQENVDTYSNKVSGTGGLGGHIRPQDIFVINTRFQNTAGTSNPSVADQLAVQLRTAFPCNRIIALNGIGPDGTQPGFAYALTSSAAGIYSVLFDWELMDWQEAQALGSPLPPWTYAFTPTLQRINGQFFGASATIAGTANPLARIGLAPMDTASWNYGQIAQKADRHSTRLGAPHLGQQSVQTQESCMKGAATFGARAKTIMDQYRFRTKTKIKKVRKGRKIIKKKIQKRVKIKKLKRPNLNNLALQISFSDTPNPADPLPIRNVSAATADQCVLAGLARGAGAFFFFASDDAMRMLFAQPYVASLRPSAT